MAIDSTLFSCSVPAGTYAAGDTIEMTAIRGPKVVRDGYGAAKMKKVFICQDQSSQPVGYVTIKNSNWIDEMGNFVLTASTSGNYILDDESAAVQRCGDVELQPNSSWTVTYHITEASTTTLAYDVFALIDVDYPSVAAVENPKEQQGAPVTMFNTYPVTTTAYGSAATGAWNETNVDVFKAGFRYLLAQIGGKLATSTAQIGFFSIHGAAGQSGLERLIPFPPSALISHRYNLEYSTPLVKGPMTVSMLIMGAAGTDNIIMETDYIRRG